jgi:hypothetical protein
MDSAIQSASRRFCTIYKSENSVPCQPSGRCVILSERVELSIRTFLSVEKLRTAPACIHQDISATRPDDSQCSAIFRISFQNTVMGRSLQPSGQRWIPVRTLSSIRQVSHSKSRRPDASQHGPDTRASDMEIVCIRSTVRMTIPLVRTREALVWKLLAAKVRLSGRQNTTVRTRLKTGKNFSKIFRKSIVQLSIRTTPRFYQARRSFEP